jgi:hypothetical protein
MVNAGRTPESMNLKPGHLKGIIFRDKSSILTRHSAIQEILSSPQ